MRPERCLILGLVLALGGPASGQSRPADPPPSHVQPPPSPAADETAARRALLDAATADGVAALRRDVYATPFSVELTVRQAAKRLDAFDPLDKAIQSAEQRGGPRWRDDRRACEVRLELPGSVVAAAIQDAGAQRFSSLGLTSDAFARAVAHLRTQRFAATGVGTAAGAAAADAAIVERPAADAAPVWRTVPEPARTEALHNAKNDAVSQVIDGLRRVPVGGQTLDELLAKPEVAGEIRRRLIERPATGVEYGGDMTVRLRLSAGPDEVWPVVEQTLQTNRLGPPPTDVDAWRRLRNDVIKALPNAVGRGAPPPQRAGAVPPAPAGAGQRVVPRDPPAWTVRQMDADGQAQATGLKGARAAEAMAHDQLRVQVEALELSPGLTLAEAVKRDPRVARALSDALGRARVSRVTYGVDSVGVRVTVDLDWVWRGLAAIE